jgi:hypothetical protein
MIKDFADDGPWVLEFFVSMILLLPILAKSFLTYDDHEDCDSDKGLERHSEARIGLCWLDLNILNFCFFQCLNAQLIFNCSRGGQASLFSTVGCEFILIQPQNLWFLFLGFSKIAASFKEIFLSKENARLFCLTLMNYLSVWDIFENFFVMQHMLHDRKKKPLRVQNIF